MFPRTERRGAARIDKVFRVLICTDEGGEQWCVARNISDHGLFVEMHAPVPLRTKVLVRFQRPGDEGSICAIARVQNHYFLHYSDGTDLRAISGCGLRFLRFVPEAGGAASGAALH